MNFLRVIQDASTRILFGKEKVASVKSFYDIVEKDMVGNDIKMSDFKGSVLLCANVASQWGLTNQNYTEFSQLVDEYKDNGLKILLFPCNQFGAQESGSHEDILKFVDDNYQASHKFTWFEKGHVNGADTRDTFSILKKNLPNNDGTNDIRWNFAKFLIDHEGKPYKRYSPKASPFTMKEDIEELLTARSKNIVTTNTK